MKDVTQPNPINKDRFDRLPWLISRKTVTHEFGLSDEEISMMERKGMIRRIVTGKVRGKFFKTELGKICGII